MKLTRQQSIIIGVSIGLLIAVFFVIRKLTPFKKRVVDSANEEWARFGYQTRDKDGNWIQIGYKEDDVDSYKGIQKLSEEIVDSKDKDYIYESPDGGKTIFKRMVGEDKRELVENWDEIKKDEG